jgi:hypothetical protein
MDDENIIDSGEVNLNPPKKNRKTGPKAKAYVASEYYGVQIGRAKVVVNPEEVQKLAALGSSDKEIANWFNVPVSTLRDNFRVELGKGREQLNQSLRKAQIKLAMSGNATMLIWLGKNILGQSDNPINSDANQPLPWNDD